LAGINAQALLAAIISTQWDIANRITNGVTPVLNAGPDGPSAESLRTASGCSGRDLAVARHFQRSVLPPQVWLHKMLCDQTGTPTLDKHALLVLEGWRVVLRDKVDQASMLLNDAVATLHGVLPASCTEATTEATTVRVQSDGIVIHPDLANIVTSLLNPLPLTTQTAADTTDDDAPLTSSGDDESDEDTDERDPSDA
jgi:hypothetical protein